MTGFRGDSQAEKAKLTFGPFLFLIKPCKMLWTTGQA
jgi:hypothetical protein